METTAFNLQDIKDAYRKLKTHFYYDNTNHFMRRQIAKFETSYNFEKRLNQLVSDLNNKNKDLLIEKYEKDIKYYLQPKGFKNNILDEDCESLIVTNRYISEEYQLSNFNYFIEIPIELHIVNVLWILKLGYLLDSEYCYYSDNTTSYCYANRLELDEKTGTVLPGNKLFKTYANQYQRWRDNCISVAEDLLDNHKKDVIIVSLDIKRYYPSADLDYDLVNQDLKSRCQNKDLLKEFDKYSFLTDLLKKIRDIYFKKIGSIWKLEKKEKNDTDEVLESIRPIPIGMLSSNIIANWYLRTFDEKVNKYVKPAFYGRYVDDILIVLENRGGCSELVNEKGKCDKNCCSEKRELTIDKILSQYFCGCNDKLCSHSVLIKEPIKNDKSLKNCENASNKKEKYDYFVKINENSLRIQGNKVKLFVFDANSTKAMLQKFKDTIKKHSSEFRFLPEEDRIQEDFAQETYSIDYNDTINKLRSIDKYQLDRFKISSYLAKQLMLSKYSTDKKSFKKTKEELLFAFSGRMGLELFLFWDKVLTYFVLNNNEEAFCEFIQKMLNNIKRITYKSIDKKETVLKKVKKNLISYLKESIYLSLSLNPNFIYQEANKNNKYILKKVFKKLMQNNEINKIFEKTTYRIKIREFTESAMIKHKYCFMPILNYIELDCEYCDFTNSNILELKKIPDFPENRDNRIKFNPKRFSFDEIILYENYKKLSEYSKTSTNYNIDPSDLIDKAIDIYIILNLMQFEEDSPLYEAKKEKITDYLKNCKKPFQYNSKYTTIALDINKENDSPNLYDFKIGLYNTKISDESIIENLKSQQKLSFNELQTYIKFLNLAIQNNKIKCNMIVFPEVCIPYQALGLLSDFSKKHQVAIICGLKHITIENTVLNCIVAILPFSIGYYTDSYTNLRIKEWYSPAEIKEIKKLGKDIPYEKKNRELTNNLFCWNNLYFAVYDCFELADVNYRSDFKSNVDMIIACEWNRDVDYFNNIIKSASRDLHCYTIQVNTSQFGDSKIIAPKKTFEMTMLNIKGGEDNILIGHINIEELRNFQRKETEYLDEKDRIFKPLPPAFDKKTERLKINKP